MTTIALFDLDGTLLSGDSDHQWNQYLVDNNLVDATDFQQRNDHFYQEYKAQTLDINEYLDFTLAVLTRFSLQALQEMREVFVENYIAPLITDKSRALVASHQSKGHQLAIITATNAFITEPIAALFDIPHLIAVTPEIKDNRYTGSFIDEPCFREGKINRFNKWKQQFDTIETIWFYSDSINDLPLLNYVDHPVVVDGDKLLQKQAQQNNWHSISLR